MSQPVNVVTVTVRCLVGVFLLHSPVSVLAQLIRIGEPELVFSMDDFSWDDFSPIDSKSLNCLDVNRDGSKVAFCPHPTCGCCPWPYIYQTDGHGGDPLRVSPTPNPNAGTQTVRFSRDDTKLFVGWHDPLLSPDSDIWQVNIDGSDPKVVIGGPGHQAFPCPVVVDGQDRIVYRKGWWPVDLWSADMTGGDRRQLTFDGNKTGPRASVDGTKVAYFSQTSAVTVDIFLMNSDGSEQRQITGDGAVPEDAFPAIVQNCQGEEVILYSHEPLSSPGREIWVSDLLGLQQEPLLVEENRFLYHVNYAPDDPISPCGAIYYANTPAVFCGVTEVWRVAVCAIATSPVGDPNVPDQGFGTKNRYLSFQAGDVGRQQAISVVFDSLAGFEYAEGRTMWVQEPFEVSEASGASDDSELPTFWGAQLGCTPFYTDWTTYGTVDVYDAAIVEGSVYEIRAINVGCDAGDSGSFSDPLIVNTSACGDIVGDCSVMPCTAPQGVVDFVDISAVVDRFKNEPDAPRKARTDVVNSNLQLPAPDQIVDFVDISCVVEAFRGQCCELPGPPEENPCEMQ